MKGEIDMTNAQIILNKSISLMEAGLIGTTGRTITFTDVNGESRTVSEPEDIHTFATWKVLGRKVKHGERAKAKIKIWNCQSKNNMGLRDAYFFTFSQTEPI